MMKITSNDTQSGILILVLSIVLLIGGATEADAVVWYKGCSKECSCTCKCRLAESGEDLSSAPAITLFKKTFHTDGKKRCVLFVCGSCYVPDWGNAKKTCKSRYGAKCHEKCFNRSLRGMMQGYNGEDWVKVNCN